MAGIAQKTDTLRLHTMLCCSGAAPIIYGQAIVAGLAPATSCTKAAVMAPDDGTYWDWAPHYPKATCNAGAHVRGVSRDVATGRLHGALCCK